MNIETFKTALAQSLALTKSYVIFDIKPSTVYLAAYNDFHAVCFTIPNNQTITEMKFALNKEIAQELLKNTNQFLELHLEDTFLKIKSVNVNLKLPFMNEFNSVSNLFTHYEKEKALGLDANLFKQAINFIKHSANDKEVGDVVFKSYNLKKIDNSLECMATNGATLSLISLPLLNSQVEQFNILLNPNFQDVLPFITDDSVLLTFGANKQAVSFDLDYKDYGVRVVSVLTQGEPLDYQPIYDSAIQNNTHHFTCLSKDLIDMLKKVEFFSSGKEIYERKIKLVFDIGKLVVHATNKNGEIEAEIPISNKDNIQTEITLDSQNILKYIKSLTKNSNLNLYLSDTKDNLLIDDGRHKEIIVCIY